VYGYAESVGALNAKWNQQNVTVCIINNAENYYEDLFIDAVNAWSSIWSHLKYKFGDIEDSCKITSYIVRAHADMTSSGHAGVTQTSFVPGGGIVSSSILIPTEIENQDGSIYRVTSTTFYRIAMHEFGHAIGLTHANNENYLEPIDVMAPTMAADHQNMQISSLDIEALDTLYNIETEFVPPPEQPEPLPPAPAPEPEPTPSPPTPSPTPGPQVLQKMEIDINRAVYYNNETLKFTVKPPIVVSGISATVLLYPSDGRDRITMHIMPDNNGIINVEVPLPGKELGIWTVKVTYVSWMSQTAFALKDSGSIPSALGSSVEEFSLNADQSVYALGDAVALYGMSAKTSGWWLEVIDPQGRLFAKLNPDSMKLKSGGAYEAIFTAIGDPVKSIGTWKAKLMEGSIPVERASVSFDVIRKQVEEPKTDVQIQAKQIRDIVLLRVRNMASSNLDVYGLIINTGNNTIEACREAKGWSTEICKHDQAIFFTDNNPLSPDERAYFLFKVSGESPVLSWEAFDEDRHLLDNGLTTALIM
jgi:hypothetical protein